MTSAEIRAFIEHFIHAWEEEDLPALLDCYAEDARLDSPMFHTVEGRAQIGKSFSDLFEAFDDWDLQIDDILIERGPDDRAALVFTSHVTHRGVIFGMPGTGRRVETKCALILRFKNGRIASERRLYDFTGLLVQLGVLKARAV